MIDYVYHKIQKKRGDSPLLAPRFEALGLPTLSKRATLTPRRYAKLHLTHKTYKQVVRYLHTHGRLSLQSSLTRFESFLGFRNVKNKARDIRLLNIWYPTPP